MTTSSIIKIFK